ncbi:hypothetical protein [Pseudoalteromonas sp. NCIMB_1079]|uniref:hypothetical protein n=1 Tax=Pseudoalteromonas sp. NCIMB 1079 TaxID=3142847 RepID=UPI00339C59DF
MLDSTKFPLVYMTKNTSSEASKDDQFKELEDLLKLKQPFVIISDGGFSDKKHEHSKEENKKMSRWMKKNKVEMKSYIQSMILIEPSLAKRLAAKTFAITFNKFWGYPLLIADSKEDALNIAHALIGK